MLSINIFNHRQHKLCE